MHPKQWRKEMLAVPNMLVLAAALAHLEAGLSERSPVAVGVYKPECIQKSVRHAILEDYRARADQDIDDGLSLGEVQDFYLHQIYVCLFGDGTLLPRVSPQPWWYPNDRKAFQPKRVAALKKFIEACKKAAPAPTYLYKAHLGDNHPRISKAISANPRSSARVEVVREDGSLLVERRDSTTHGWRDSWEEAHQLLLTHARIRLEDQRRQLQLAQSYEGAVRGLKKRNFKPKDAAVEPTEVAPLSADESRVQAESVA